MSCPFPQFMQGQRSPGDRCDNVHCPAWEDCTGIWEPEEEARAFYVVLIGPLTDGPVGYLGNVRHFCDVAADLMLCGFCPLNPATDLLECLANPAIGVQILQRRTRQMLKLASLASRRAALCLGTSNGHNHPSAGALRELTECARLGVPVVRSLGELRELRGSEP